MAESIEMRVEEEEAFTLLGDELYEDASMLEHFLMQRAGKKSSLSSGEQQTQGSVVQEGKSQQTPTNDATHSPHDSSRSRPSPHNLSRRNYGNARLPLSRRAAASPNHVIPRLAPSRTAPTNGNSINHPLLKMAQSYAFGVVDAPGDTQPDSQIYRNYTSILRESSIIGGPPENGAAQENPNGAANSTQDDPRTDPTDMRDRSDQDGSNHPTSPTTYNDDMDGLIETRYRTDNPTSPIKFMTPAMAGRKRNNQGEIMSSGVKTTPGTTLTAAFFGNGLGDTGGPTMGLTQLFNATQGATSPMPDAPRSDPVFQRPSPNFANRRQSSPAPVTSSPSKLYRTDPSRATTEPRDEYMTMKESQELRERQRQAQLDLQQLRAQEAGEDDDWDNEPTVAQRIAAARRAKAKRDEETRESYARVKAPSREPEGRTGGRKKPVLLSSDAAFLSPARSYRTTRRGLSLYDGPDEDEYASDDSPDELAIVPVSSNRSSKSMGRMESGVQVPNTSSRPTATIRRTQSHSPPDSPIRRSIQISQIRATASQGDRPSQTRRRGMRSTQTSAIADSQPDHVDEAQSLPPRKPRETSAMDTNNVRSLRSQQAPKRGRDSQVSSSIPTHPPSTSQVPEDEIVHEDEERMPSSPPIVFDDHSEDEQDGIDGSEIDVEDMELVHDHKPRELEEGGEMPDTDVVVDMVHSSQLESVDHRQVVNAKNSPRKRQNTVPESDSLDDPEPTVVEPSQVTSSSKTPATQPSTTDTTAAQHQTNSTDLFQTANTHLSASPQKRIPTQSSKSSEVGRSPRVTRLRKLTDIANDPDTQHSTDVGEIEIPDMETMNEGYDEFEKMLSGSSPVRPTRKRRKIMTYSAKKSLSSPAKSMIPPSAESPSPVEQARPSQSETRSKSDESNHTNTTPSSRVREEQGALAAAQAREAVFMKPAVLKMGRLPRPTKTPAKPSGLKNVTATLNKARASRSSKYSDVFGIAETPQSKNSFDELTHRPSGDGNVDTADPVVEAEVNGADEIIGEEAQPHEEPVDDGTAGEWVAENQVFARWPSDMSFYAATCTGRTGPQRLSIKWDDETTAELDEWFVRNLHLQIGDSVKVDIPKMKVLTYVVVGFADKIKPAEEEFAVTDVLGHKTVILEEKKRESLAEGAATAPQKTIKAPIENIYLTHTLWNQFKDRPFRSHSPQPGVTPRAETPSIAPSVPGTPMSRTRRIPYMVAASTYRAPSVISSALGNGIFANMAFAITFTKDTSNRESITNMITYNGAYILDGAFETLFEPLDFPSDHSAQLPKPIPKSKEKKPAAHDTQLALKSKFSNLGFVALITDDHSRRTKYMEALALDIPCLHYRWVRDSIAASSPLPFAKYLLAAGSSTYLSNTLRSRTLTPYDPISTEASFANVLERREKLAKGQNVLMVTQGKVKTYEERKKPYLFLLHAMGSNRIGRCFDLQSAKQKVTSEDWNWVYVDGDGKSVEEAAKILFGSTGGQKRKSGSVIGSAKEAKSRKRRRDEDEEDEDGDVKEMKYGFINGKKVRVAGDEFGVQSLILGALVE